MDCRFHGKEALDIYAGAGCEVDYTNDRVKFPRNLVIDSIEACPAEFTLCGRDPKNDTLVGGKRVAYKNFGNRSIHNRSLYPQSPGRPRNRTCVMWLDSAMQWMRATFSQLLLQQEMSIRR